MRDMHFVSSHFYFSGCVEEFFIHMCSTTEEGVLDDIFLAFVQCSFVRLFSITPQFISQGTSFSAVRTRDRIFNVIMNVVLGREGSSALCTCRGISFLPPIFPIPVAHIDAISSFALAYPCTELLIQLLHFLQTIRRYWNEKLFQFNCTGVVLETNILQTIVKKTCDYIKEMDFRMETPRLCFRSEMFVLANSVSIFLTSSTAASP